MVESRKRAKGTRAKTGCLTCRIRRVKCGEERPSCLRCTSTGRICDAYRGTSSSRSSSGATSDSGSPHPLRCLLPSIEGDNFEKEAFYFFRTHCTMSLAGRFDQSFWERTVLQLSHYQPAVRHSIIAVATLLRSKPTSEPGKDNAVKHYVQGISTLNRYMAEPGQISPVIVLTVCLLFISFEVIRGNLQGAIIHLNSGMAILKQLPPLPNSSPAARTAIEELQTLFARLDIQAATYAPIYVPQLVSIPELPTTFETVHSMRNTLTSIAAMSHYWLRNKGEAHKYDETIPEDVLSQHKAIGSLLRRWRNLSSKLSASPSNAMNIAILRVQHIALSIRIAAGLDSTESSYDAHLEEFAELVSLAAKIIKDQESNPRNEAPVTFSLDMGLVQPLYFVACKCRLQPIRCHALKLMGQAGREGVWVGDMMSTIASFVIELEHSPDDDGAEGLDGELPEETRRVHGTSIDVNLERQMVNVSCSRRALDWQWYFADRNVSW